ncbi:MAG: hypothetical protein ACTTH7_01030 [Treponema sp.]
MKQRLFFFTFSFIFSLSPLAAEPFRVNRMHTCVLDARCLDPVVVTAGYNDAVACTTHFNSIFLEGIELEIKQPKEALDAQNALAYTIYTSIAPDASSEKIDYTGNKLVSNVMPNRSSFIIRIPFKEKNTLAAIPNALLLPYEEKNAFETFVLRFNPIISSLPEVCEQASYKVIIRPLLIAEGGLKLNISYPDNEIKPINIQINRTYIPQSADIQLLTPGSYILNVTSNSYRSEIRSCTIERGKITSLDITLKSLTPKLRILVPQHIGVFVNEKEWEYSDDFVPIPSGVHIVVFKIGSYEITRQIIAEEGKSYDLSLTMEVNFDEVQ